MLGEQDERLVFDKESGRLIRYPPRRRKFPVKALAISLLFFITISAFVIWKESEEARVVGISDFQVSQESNYLKASFRLVNAKNEVVTTDGMAQLYLYNGKGYLIYSEKISFSHKNFKKYSNGWEYSWQIPKIKLDWKPPEGEFTAEFVQRGFAVLKVVVNGGKNTLTTKNTIVTFYSAEEAEEIVKELYRKRVLEKLKRWLWENRYSISEFGCLGYPLDLSINDIAIVGNHAWAVGYLHGVGGYGRILYSPDGGNTWEVQWHSSTWGPDPFKVVFLNEKEGWVAANKAILHTLDGGRTWNVSWRASGGLSWDLVRGFKVIDRQHLWARLANGNMLRSTDGGKTWQVQKP